MISTAASIPFALGMLAAGFIAGWLHFGSLAVVARKLAEGRNGAVLLQLARFAALGLFLYVSSRLGALPLIAAATGILGARPFVLRWISGNPKE
jgi:F1F0 ATPase subunit 2